MPFNQLSPDEIRSIAEQSQRNHTRRIGIIRAAASLPRVSSSGGGRTPVQSATQRAMQALGTPTSDSLSNMDRYQAMREAGREQAELNGFGWANTIDDVIRSTPLAVGTSIVDAAAAEILQPMDESEAPKNATQWLLNFLSTGLYAGARFSEQIGARVAQTNDPAYKDAYENMSYGEQVGENIGGLLSPLGGLARGVAEGFGARFDGERPRTQGQNLESIGVNDQIREGLGNLGADEFGQGLGVGAAGLAADIAGDPFTWVGSLGAVGLLRGATNAAGQATRAAVAGAPGARNAFGIAAAIARGGAEGRRAALMEQMAARAARVTRAERRAGNVNGSPATAPDETLAGEGNILAETVAEGVRRQEVAAADDAARAADEMVAEGGPAPREAEATPIAAAGEAVAAPEPARAPSLTAAAPLDDAVRGMQTEPSLAGDPQAILTAARGVASEMNVPAPLIGRVFEELGGSPVNGKLPGLAAAVRELSNDPAGQAFLSTPVRPGASETWRQVFASDDLQAKFSNEFDALGDAVDAGAPIGAPGVGTGVDPKVLGEQLIASLGKKAAGKYDPKKLATELDGLNETEQVQVLAGILTRQGRKIKSFEDAMQAAMTDQLSASNMRIMLNALGIKTKASTAAGLKKTLSGNGVARWEELKASVATEAEVLARHSIDETTAAAAARVDLDAHAAAARETVQEFSDEALGDPAGVDAINATVDAGNQQALVDDITEAIVLEMQQGARAVDDVTEQVRNVRISRRDSRLAAVAYAGARERSVDVIKRTSSKLKETFDQEEWLAAWRGGMTVLKVAANRLSKVTNMGRTNAARADMLFEPMMRAMRLTTAHNISEGRIPRLQASLTRRDGTTWVEDPVYLSVDQIIDFLPPEVAKRALFYLDYAVSKAGEGSTAAAREAFSKGITVYPTSLATMARAAMKNIDPMEGLRRSGRRPSDFETTPEGKAVLEEIAQAMRAPEVQRGLRLLNDAQQLVYVAYSIGKVNKIMGTLASRIISAVSRRGGGFTPPDRSLLLAEIQHAIEEVDRLAVEGGSSLVHELADERLTNGLLSLLGEPGTMVVRADARLAAIDKRAPEVKLQEKIDAGKPAPKNPDGTIKQPKPTRSAESKKQEREMRAAANAARTEEAEEFEPMIVEATAQRMARGDEEETDLGVVNVMDAVTQDLGIFRVFASIGRGLISDWGQQGVKPAQVMASSGLYAHTELFVNALTRWSNGYGRGANKVPPLAQRIADDLGEPKPLSVDDVNGYVSNWWTSMARIEQNWLETTGREMSPEELRLGLEQGMARAAVGEDGPLDGVDALSPAQVNMALELREYIRDAFGAFERMGIEADAVNYYLRKFGFRDDGQFAGAKRLDLDKPLSTQANIWRSYEMADGGIASPLDLIANVHKAAQAAMVRPSIAQSLTFRFSKKVEGEWTVERLRAEGFKKPAPADELSIARYLDADRWYPAEFFEQIAYADHFLKKTDTPEGLGAKVEAILRPYDVATGMVKSMQTVWNPAHHASNIMGEHFSILLSGKNPLKTPRSLPVLKAMQQLSDQNIPPIDAYRQLTQPVNAGQLTAAGPGGKWEGARVKIGGVFYDLTPEQLGQRALKDGVAVTARESKDLLTYAEDASGRTAAAWKAITNSRLNIIARADHALGRLSAVRDNYTRIGHYIDELESREWDSVEQMWEAAAKRVHEYHPTIQTLTAFDIKFGRRMLMYYSWVKQMAFRVIAVALERPALVTLPSKIQYNMAEGQGLEPESIGKPFPSDPRIAEYYKDGVVGPSWFGGFGPFEDPNSIPIDSQTGLPMSEPNLWGMSLSSPQMDALFTLFGGLNAGQTPQEAFFHYAQLGNVFLKMPAELMTDSRVGGVGAPPSSDLPGYFLSQTGMPSRLGSALGLKRDEDLSPEEQWGEQQRAILNWTTGLKFQNYTNSTSQAVARSDRGQADRDYLRQAGYTEEQVDAIADLWREIRDEEYAQQWAGWRSGQGR